MKRFVCGITAVLLAAAAMMAGCSASKKEESFTPRLDRDANPYVDIFMTSAEFLQKRMEPLQGAVWICQGKMWTLAR